ncbi:MAG: tRNA pseudouridine(38-40) synthase TruA [Candidatus Marinimicrobia bacterium]|nr:tRNA pseudouridine(38-40) synthase TruA [Candidatus Neomarinimicrobiota bacterium]MCF7850697.1 tRNA pseudouridine(38-40) synthase TruA [Candidatus Neomarinimicrobiota bacterium]MCF7905159.1 tRNA pseudouridine(38-40) synthase TruA [Candidatus Neomarinimicrobiota bacterium]
MRVAVLVQYEGTSFNGWQVQPDKPTIQGEIEDALEKIYGERIGIMGSGRTDSGVHAFGQVAHFDVAESPIPVQNIWMTLNKHLPQSIRIVSSQPVADDFHSRFQARERSYRYEINTRFNILQRDTRWFVRYIIDQEALMELTGLIHGSHDFSSFCYAGTETENMMCNIQRADWIQLDEGGLAFYITADRFLHHMVRMLAGSMVEVARGKWTLDHFKALLENPDRQNHAVTAPASGLTLLKVTYPDSIQPNWVEGHEKFANGSKHY